MVERHQGIKMVRAEHRPAAAGRLGAGPGEQND